MEQPNVDEVEERVRDEIMAREGDTLDAIEAMLNQYLAGFRAIGSFTPTEDNRIEQAWFLLTGRTFNSLRWSYELLKNGYYAQPMMMIKAASEDWLVCEDIKEHPETLDALLEQTGTFPSFQTMANRLEDPLKNEWKGSSGEEGTYGFLNTFGHPHPRSVRTMVDPGTGRLRIGPGWDEALFLATANSLLRVIVRMAEFVARLALDESVLKELKVAIDQANARRDNLFTRARALLEESK